MTAELVWGLKASLRAYVDALPDGLIEPSGGASRGKSGEFHFPFATTEIVSEDASTEYRYEGTVSFSGHGDAMHVTIGDPRVAIANERATLSVFHTAGRDPGSRVVVVQMTVTSSGADWIGHPVRLTADGAVAMGALQYYEGQPVDDLHFSVK